VIEHGKVVDCIDDVDLANSMERLNRYLSV
jgi:hypothetical protein